MTLLLNVVLLIVGFALLIKGADYFVEGAAGIADKFHIPQIIIGLTIVAFGTSAPEAAISIGASIKGTAGIAVGNILGSNIMNILLILGITACIRRLSVQKNSLKYEVPFLCVITIVLVLMGHFQGELNWISGIILWIFFIIFFIYLIQQAKAGMQVTEEIESDRKYSIPVLLLMTILGIAAIVFGSDLTVDNASALASAVGMDDRLIGLTIVAFGTSLPELMTSVAAARKGNADIAVGNIIGSNIFNILFVLGTASLIHPIVYESKFLFDGICAIAAVVILFVCAIRRKELRRGAGIFMLAAYAAYFAYLLI